MQRLPFLSYIFFLRNFSIARFLIVLHQNVQPTKGFWIQVRLARLFIRHVLTEQREAISPYGEELHPTLSSTHSTHPPSYQQWPEYNSNDVSPQDPAGMGFGSKYRPMDDVAISPGLESVWAGEGDKEVVIGTVPTEMPPTISPPDKKPARVCGLRRPLFWSLLAATFAIVVGLAIGLGVGLGVKHKHKKASSPTKARSSDYYIGGALDPAYFSREGAFNGSGLALASQSFGSGEYGELVLYFQHYSGSIRWQRMTPENPVNGWQGGTASEVVATDAKNSTPLSAVAYSLNGVSTVSHEIIKALFSC